MASTTSSVTQGINHLPRWAYIVLAILAAAIGLASSAVTAQFFVLGLERIETDAVARDVLIATGVLMILTELISFGLAALLPINQLRALRSKLILCGVLLLSFEAVTIYVTQIAMMRTSDSVTSSTTNRVDNLKKSIENRRSASADLRANGKTQSASSHAWTRSLGAAALRDALEVERQIEPLVKELAELEASARPTMSTVLGVDGMLAYSVVRALLISVMGLVMFATAGALLREARASVVVAAESTPGNVESTPESTPESTVAASTFRSPARGFGGSVAAVPVKVAGLSAPAFGLVSLPLGAFAAAPMVISAPNPPLVSTQASLAESQVGDQNELGNPDNPESEVKDARYLRIRCGVASGEIKPSVRGIQANEGGGTLVVRQYLRQLEFDGITERAGKGWVRKS